MIGLRAATVFGWGSSFDFNRDPFPRFSPLAFAAASSAGRETQPNCAKILSDFVQPKMS